jgi:glycosyltransferase involved in cell wall biosynthesis
VSAPRRRIAVLVDRYAPSIFAGAPLHAFALAQHLQHRYDVELLTTTAADPVTWANALPAGVETIDGLTVRRFAIDVEREKRHFDRLSKRLLRQRHPSIAEQERWMATQGPLSLDLLRYLARERTAYDAFVFVSYLYATTYFGLPIVADRACLLPLTHDEWALRFSLWDRLFALPRGFAYNTPEERSLTAARFPHARTSGPAIGVGVAAPASADPDRFRRRFGIDRPFALYLGRVDASKNVPALLRAYRAQRRSGGRDLVLVGTPSMDVRPSTGVHVTGAVDDETKWDALDACDLLVQPSHYESLSLVALEAWASGKPVIANARAEAVAGQIRRSGGGLTYTNDRGFAAALDALDPQRALVYGARGRAFVDEHYRWPIIEERFATHLATTFGWPEQGAPLDR